MMKNKKTRPLYCEILAVAFFTHLDRIGSRDDLNPVIRLTLLLHWGDIVLAEKSDLHMLGKIFMVFLRPLHQKGP